MTLHLFIDTTLSGTSLALVSHGSSEGSPKKFIRTQPQRGAADSALCHFLAEGMEELGKELGDVDTIIVAQGPGSFTGIKVGLAWAYGFQAARKENLLVGMSSLLEGRAELVRHLNENALLLLPISRREAFLCSEGVDAESAVRSIVLYTETAERELADHIRRGQTLVAIGIDTGLKEWLQSKEVSFREYAMDEFMQFAMQGMMSKASSLDLAALRRREILPTYLKKSSVEEKFANQGAV